MRMYNPAHAEGGSVVQAEDEEMIIRDLQKVLSGVQSDSLGAHHIEVVAGFKQGIFIVSLLKHP